METIVPENRIETEWMVFERDAIPGRKTERWTILNKRSGGELGFCQWYGSWRQYVFMPSGGCVFNANCLDQINDLVKTLNWRHKQARREGARE